MSIPSNSAFAFFLADYAGNHDGFNFTLERGRCAYDCNGNGHCVRGSCECRDGFVGRFCERHICLEGEKTRGPCKNGGSCDGNGRCWCMNGYHGEFCEAEIQDDFWEPQDPWVANVTTTGRASHASVLIDDVIWTVSGERFHNLARPLAEVEQFNTTSRLWSEVQTKGGQPSPRYDHTLVKYKDKLYMFGGVMDRKKTVSELWSLDTKSHVWSLVSAHNDDLATAPIAVAGHTAHVVNNSMFVIFGYNPYRRFVYEIQKYDFDTNTWSLVEANDPVGGRYGHSSVYYASQQTFLVYGGISDTQEGSGNQNNVSESLQQYIIQSGTWKTLNSSGKPLFKHTAVILNGLMIVAGGNNARNDSLTRDYCFSDSILIYDIECKHWYPDTETLGYRVRPRRYGHSMVANDEHIYVVGGFNGTMLGDVLMYTPGKCSSQTRQEDCKAFSRGVRCVFVKSSCEKYSPLQSYAQSFLAVVKNEPPNLGPACPGEVSRLTVSVCEELQDCLACSAASGCGWCVAGNQCLHSDSECVDGQEMIKSYTKCGTEAAVRVRPRPCSMALDCISCKLLKHCNWFGYESRNSCISHVDQAFITSEMQAREAERLASATVPVRINSGLLPTGLPLWSNLSTCPATCEEHGDCKACLSSNCMWCGSVQRCVNINSYLISFPYGQCHQWTSNIGNDSTKYCELDSSNCELHKECGDCQQNPNCGWMDGGEGTGRGECKAGNSTGPFDKPSFFNKNQWFFVGCPQCQCNGHSSCFNATSGLIPTFKCEQCEDHTKGDSCETCADGYWGDARNGGNCTECTCVGAASGCEPSDGRCHCTTKGVLGLLCDKCDQKYHGSPQNGTPCFYELTVDFIFTFNLKNDTDPWVTEIFLFSIPYKRETDVTFQINCTPPNNSASTAAVSLNLTTTIFEGRPGKPVPKMVNQPCDANGFRRVYSANDPTFQFGTEHNTTFFVQVHNFTTPYVIKISFAQSPPINWVLFFVIFAACFIVLLVLAGLLWMVKLRIEGYRNRQQHMLELVQRNSRPSKTIRVDLSAPSCNYVATPIAIEPRSNYKAGVFTLLVRLPTGGRPYTPHSTAGMALASSLCLLTPTQESMLRESEEGENRPTRKANMKRFFPFMRSSN